MYVQITVKKVFVKELQRPDRRGNTHSVSILGVDDEYGDEVWYSLGTTKQSKFGQIKVKAGTITEGAVIDFEYEQKENGRFNNITTSTLNIVQQGKDPDAGKGSGSYSGKGYSGKGKSGGKQGGFDNVGIAVGAAMNQAVSLVAAGSVDYDEVATVARELYAIAEEIKAEAANGGTAGSANSGAKPERKPARQQRKPEPEPAGIDDEFEDDIPF